MFLTQKNAAPVRSVFEELDDFLNTSKSDRFNHKIAPLSVKSDSSSIYVDVELPGMDKKDITIEYHEGVLSISGEKKSSLQKEGDTYTYSEIRSGSFTRQINIGKDIRFDDATATYTNGVLSLTIPKSTVDSPKKLVL